MAIISKAFFFGKLKYTVKTYRKINVKKLINWKKKLGAIIFADYNHAD